MHDYNYVIDSLTLGAEATSTAAAEEEYAMSTSEELPWWHPEKEAEAEAGGAAAKAPVLGGGGRVAAPLKPYKQRPTTYTPNGTDPLSKQLRLKGFANKGRRSFDGRQLKDFYKITGGAGKYTAQLYKYPANTAKYDTLIVDLPTWFCQAKNSAKTVEIEYVQVYHRAEYKTEKEEKRDEATGELVLVEKLDEDGKPIPLPDEEQDPYTQLMCTCHSDLVQVNTSADCCLGCTNMMYSFPKKYVIGNSVGSFNMWFRDMSGKIVDVDPFKTHLIVELILRW